MHFPLHLTTFIHFNELGRITHHEDIWGLKEVLEALPIVGSDWGYGFARRVVGGLAGAVLGVVLKKVRDEERTEKRTDMEENRTVMGLAGPEIRGLKSLVLTRRTLHTPHPHTSGDGHEIGLESSRSVNPLELEFSRKPIETLKGRRFKEYDEELEPQIDDASGTESGDFGLVGAAR